MKEVTYSLKGGSKNSEEYYQTIRKVADEVLTRGEMNFGRIIDEYSEFIKKYNLEELRGREEYILELLSFGILWQTYSGYALGTRVAPFITLSKLAEWRKRNQRWKPVIDFIRGLLITAFLLPKRKRKLIVSLPVLLQVDYVCKWFEATGEFREEALRFVRWRAFWGTMDELKLNDFFLSILEFTKWFRIISGSALNIYTQNVDEFIHKKESDYRWREDRISCMRSRDEYHLNMVGAELLNRAFRDEYRNTAKKVVLLPGCMRARAPEKCEAEKYQKGLKCIGCEAGCHVNTIRIIGQKKNFEVFVIPHASDLSLWAPEKEGMPKGIIASACVTTLVEGGWELKRYGVPAQCILLEASGCKKHWHSEGIMTEINKRELDKILAY